MEDLDLNIHNYNLDELLNLFNLKHDFSIQNLKAAFRIVASTHPDKSGLPSEYFLFFKKAYSILLDIYRSKNRTTKFREDYTNDEREKLCQQLKSRKDFPTWFNAMYEENVKVHDEERDTGYGDWLKEEQEDSVKCKSIQDMHNYIEQKRKECREIAIANTTQDFEPGCGGYNLTRDKPTEYSSDVFGKLRYEDLRKAHTETVIPVTEEDLKQRPVFKSTDDLLRYRKRQTIKPQSEAEARQTLSQNKTEQDKEQVQQLYKMMKQDEEYSKANQSWWSRVKQITNVS